MTTSYKQLRRYLYAGWALVSISLILVGTPPIVALFIIHFATLGTPVLGVALVLRFVHRVVTNTPPARSQTKGRACGQR